MAATLSKLEHRVLYIGFSVVLPDEHDFLHPLFLRRCVSQKVTLAFLFAGHFLHLARLALLT